MPTGIVWRLVLARPLLHVSRPPRHPDGLLKRPPPPSPVPPDVRSCISLPSSRNIRAYDSAPRTSNFSLSLSLQKETYFPRKRSSNACYLNPTFRQFFSSLSSDSENEIFSKKKLIACNFDTLSHQMLINNLVLKTNF